MGYEAMLQDLATDAPQVALVLATAHERRTRNLARFSGGHRFAGINELLVRLNLIGAAFREEPRLTDLAFLVRRATGDFMTTVEATLTGYYAAASNGMRDVIEIQHLFMDFAVDPARAQEWLTCDEKIRMKVYGPAAVRKRLKAAGVMDFDNNAVSADYKGHSMALHVSPVRLPTTADGIISKDSFLNEAGFWEMFEHARGLWHALILLTQALAPGSAAETVAKEEFGHLEAAGVQAEAAQQAVQIVFEAAYRAPGGDADDLAARLTSALMRAVDDDTRTALRASSDPDALVEQLRAVADGPTIGVPAAARLLLTLLEEVPAASSGNDHRASSTPSSAASADE